MSSSNTNDTVVVDNDNNDELLQLPILTNDEKTWINKSFISVNQITIDGLLMLFNKTNIIRNDIKNKKNIPNKSCDDKIIGTIFYEGSTRTSCSFQTSICKLGGKYIHIDGTSKGNTSASKKGESLLDTIKCIECYVDCLIIRHPIVGTLPLLYKKILNGFLTKPIINAGDGIGEHPTQALLDFYTIYDELKLYNNNNDNNAGDNSSDTLIVVMLGDLKHGRTVHSLTKILTNTIITGKFCNIKNLILRYCSPKILSMPTYIHDYVTNIINEKNNNNSSNNDVTIKQETYTNINDAINGNNGQSQHQQANVLYVTRIQKERFDETGSDNYDDVKGSYIINKQLINDTNYNGIIMHPLPRVDEISTDIDMDTKRSVYFRQMENGMYVRMALLSLILQNQNQE